MVTLLLMMNDYEEIGDDDGDHKYDNVEAMSKILAEELQQIDNGGAFFICCTQNKNYIG